MTKMAVVFPGQGSQFVGMLASYFQMFPIVSDTFHEASEVLGYDLFEVTQQSKDKLNETAVTQPALLTSSVALWRIFQSKINAKPVVMAGHSLGEYSALVCSGSLAFKDAVRLVAKRGEYMQEAVPQGIGAMAAIIMLSSEEVSDICHKASNDNEIVSCANFNAPGQIVIAGHLKAVEQAMKVAKEKGAKLVKLLDVSVPSHCELMKEAACRLSVLLNNIEWGKPLIPVIQNVDAKSHDTIEEIKSSLSLQLYSPVDWVHSVENMITLYQAEIIIECGPGKVLTGLNKRIVDTPAYSISEPDQLNEVLNLV